jgi:DNA-binding transcriptional regulator YdaS (Cro superfamily)
MTFLAQHLADQKISQKAFAGRLGVDPSIVSRLVNNGMRPSLELAVAIERETGGVVTASSWIPEVAASADGSLLSADIQEKDAAA